MEKKNALKANIEYHTKLANIYDDSQPHFKIENQKQIKKLMKLYSLKIGAGRLLDLGCGTGFILSLAMPYFNELYGIDITPAMLDLAKFKFKKVKKIKLIQASSEHLPFRNSLFDVLTSYSFLHHLSSIGPTLKEAFRVLKKGGIFYSDLDPNYYFWQAIKSAAKEKKVSRLLKIDVNSICHMTRNISEMAPGLSRTTIKKAEYVEGFKGGFKEENLRQIFLKTGFKTFNLEYHWFWQEGRVIKNLSPADALYFEKHLRAALPLTKHLFKYIKIEAIK